MTMGQLAVGNRGKYVFNEITQLVADLAVKVTVGRRSMVTSIVVTQLAADLAVKVAVGSMLFNER